MGEEYDGGFAYFGVNAADNRSTPVSWEHWLTNPPSDQEVEADGKARAERSVMPIQAYPWTLLNTSSSWAINFTASGLYSRHVVRFSLSGLPEASDLTVQIDGSDLDWVPRQDIGVDRWHYDIHREGGLSDGIHGVKFILNNPEREGIAQMCSVEVLEFGNEQQYVHVQDQWWRTLMTCNSDSTPPLDITASIPRMILPLHSFGQCLCLCYVSQLFSCQRNNVPSDK